MADAAPETPAPAGSDAVWVRSVIGWDVAFWGFLAISATTSFLADLTDRERAAYLGMLVVLAVVYQLIGRPAARDRVAWKRHAYRIVLVVVCGVASGFFPETMFLLFIAFPQIWFLSERIWEGVVFSVAVLVAVGAAKLSGADGSVDTLGEVVPWLVISLAVSCLMGIWIHRVINESEERGELIAKLRAAQDELATAHHSAGVMAERERVAREIHDTLAQGMTSVVMLAQTAQADLELDQPGAAAAKLAAIEDTARENLAEARALVAAFTPAALAGATLAEVLRRQAARFGAETGVDVQVELDLPDEEVAALPAGQQVVLLRAAQEGLANVRKHAEATRVWVRLGIGTDGVGIEIRDDGRGFEPANADGGFGLAAMRGRVEDSGGTVAVESTPGHGTRIQVQLPNDPAEVGAS